MRTIRKYQNDKHPETNCTQTRIFNFEKVNWIVNLDMNAATKCDFEAS